MWCLYIIHVRKSIFWTLLIYIKFIGHDYVGRGVGCGLLLWTACLSYICLTFCKRLIVRFPIHPSVMLIVYFWFDLMLFGFILRHGFSLLYWTEKNENSYQSSIMSYDMKCKYTFQLNVWWASCKQHVVSVFSLDDIWSGF